MSFTSKYLTGSLAIEYKTLAYMVRIYCQAHHGSNEKLCSECQALLDYAEKKLDRCPYGDGKPACKKCPIHCYKPAEKELMREIMRYAGPRIILYHPILALRHLRNERKAFPQKPPSGISNYHLRKNRRHKNN